MAEPNDWQDADDWVDAPEEAAGEAGHAGTDPYKHKPMDPTGGVITPDGTLGDAVKSAADIATLGLAPQLEGAMAGLAQAAVDPRPGADLQAYRAVRDMGKQEHEASGRTTLGQAAKPLGALMTPVPVKSLGAGATVGQRMAQGAKVGGGVGFIQGAANSGGDLTKMDGENWKRVLADALAGGAGGAIGGGVSGGVLAKGAPAMSSVAETQALRAAGLRGGITNQLRKQIGVDDMDEARQLGRAFLDEGLIPPVGSAEAVAKRAERLQGVAGNAKGATLAEAQSSGRPFDYQANASAVRTPIADPTITTALARNRAAGKSLQYADDIAEQGALTPGDWRMGDKTKSDAWQSANFEADPDLTPKMYRQAVGRSRDDIERQIGGALGPEAQRGFSEANRRYGVGADALHLAKNASTRDAAKKGFGMQEILAMATGAGAGHATGHAASGGALGLGLALGGKAFDKYGHSSLARFSDFLAKRGAANTGGGVGGVAGGQLAPYLDMLKDDEP